MTILCKCISIDCMLMILSEDNFYTSLYSLMFMNLVPCMNVQMTEISVQVDMLDNVKFLSLSFFNCGV